LTRSITKTLLGMDIFYGKRTIYIVTTVDLPLAVIMMFVERWILHPTDVEWVI
jgi:hypothetical protein